MKLSQTDRLDRKREQAQTWMAREKYLLEQIQILSARVDSLESYERERQASMGRD